MKILIDDGMQIKVGTGIGRYTEYLYNSLKNKNVDVDMEQYDITVHSKILRRLKYLLHLNSLNYYKKCGKYNAVHFTNYIIPYIRNNKCKYIVTIHDLASFLHPETIPIIHRKYGQSVARYAIKHCDEIITVSQSVKKEIIERFPLYAHKVHVIYPGLYDEIKPVYDLSQYENEKLKGLEPKKFFLFIGTIEKRKNIGMILDAFFSLKEKCFQASDFKLVLAGRPGYGYDGFIEKCKTSHYINDVIFPGYTSVDDCSRLYSNASAYIFPTFYEGFGSTQLECMVCHTPLILSDIPTNREVSKDYGLYFKLNDIESLVQQMQYIADGKFDKEKAINIADELLQTFSWDKISEQYIELYNKLR